MQISGGEQRVRSFWTGAAMRSAGAMPDSSGNRVTAHLDAPPIVRGAARWYPQRAPETALPSSIATPVDASQSAVARLNGVVFASAGRRKSRCSGTAVNSPNLSLVFTAAHCLKSGGPFGHWLKNWIFVPGFKEGSRPYGKFVAKWLAVPPQWTWAANENFDFGVAVVGPNEEGRRLVDAVGGAGIAFGQDPNQIFDVYGYPADPPFSGGVQQKCAQTPYLGSDLESMLQPGPQTLRVDCNFTSGASGGGWLIEGSFLNSVTGYGYPEDPSQSYGAYFGNAAASLYKRAGRWR